MSGNREPSGLALSFAVQLCWLSEVFEGSALQYSRRGWGGACTPNLQTVLQVEGGEIQPKIIGSAVGHTESVHNFHQVHMNSEHRIAPTLIIPRVKIPCTLSPDPFLTNKADF